MISSPAKSRLASLVAIAKGDVPVEHWYASAAPSLPSRAGKTLLSWSGTMFEYLMPVLFTRTLHELVARRWLPGLAMNAN